MVTPPPAKTIRATMRFSLKLGFISFGGPAGQITMMHQELVDKRRWISDRRNRPQAGDCSAMRRIDWRASAGNTSST